MTATVERRYRMIRLEAGDYLVPSNDKQRMWRIYRYADAGSLDGGLTGEFWACARFDGSMERALMLAEHDPVEFVSWSVWEHWAGPFALRSEAIQEALRA